ncbi:hypothetical protein ACQEU8_19010 [Streptomyces sp. CA-250714]|uniref:hypothetical protein n=1 Tax=Streptomyces sp. CA-250714 TaxID=3240060 RepID=UPI003D9217B4
MLPELRILFRSALAVTVLASLLGVLLSYYRITAGAAFVLILVSLAGSWVTVIFGLILSRKTKLERRARYERVYPTRDALLQALDDAAIRTVRDSKGRVHAVRALRKQVPDVPLAEALAVVDGL